MVLKLIIKGIEKDESKMNIKNSGKK